MFGTNADSSIYLKPFYIIAEVMQEGSSILPLMEMIA